MECKQSRVEGNWDFLLWMQLLTSQRPWSDFDSHLRSFRTTGCWEQSLTENRELSLSPRWETEPELLTGTFSTQSTRNNWKNSFLKCWKYSIDLCWICFWIRSSEAMGEKKGKYKNLKRLKKEATFAEEKKGLQNIWQIISQSKIRFKTY